MIFWEKQGLIYKPDSLSKWPTHAVLPFIDRQDEKYFIYFGSRTRDNITSSFRAEFDHKNNSIIAFSNSLVIEPGELGCFDQHGAISSSIVSVNKVKYLYYIGWTKGHEPPLFYANIGLAISKDGGKTFTKVSKAPIIPRDNNNPILMTSPQVIHVNSIFYMSYISGVKWKRNNGVLQSYYRVCSAESKNGIDWYNTGNILIDFQKGETNFARPWIIYYKDKYHMWFSKAGNKKKYSIGYASSKNLKDWVRDDTINQLKRSEKGFDSEMQCYPSVTLIGEKFYLLYNGNRFGYDGICLATFPIN